MDYYLTARFLHILLAAAWFGFTISGHQKALWFAREDPGKAAPSEQYLKTASIACTLLGLLTIGTGFWLISLLGGFEAVPWPISAGFVLAVVIALIGALPVGRSWRALAKMRTAGAAQEKLEAIAARIGFWERAIQVLWGLALATMVFRFAV